MRLRPLVEEHQNRSKSTTDAYRANAINQSCAEHPIDIRQLGESSTKGAVWQPLCIHPSRW